MLSRAKKINVHSPTSCTQHSILNFCVIFFTKITMHRHPPRVLTNTFQVSNLNLILLSKVQINSGSPNVHQTSISKKYVICPLCWLRDSRKFQSLEIRLSLPKRLMIPGPGGLTNKLKFKLQAENVRLGTTAHKTGLHQREETGLHEFHVFLT